MSDAPETNVAPEVTDATEAAAAEVTAVRDLSDLPDPAEEADTTETDATETEEPAAADASESDTAAPEATEASDDAASDDATASEAANPDADDDAFIPEESDVQAELQRERTRNNFFRTLRSTIFSLIVVAAVAVIIAMLVLPVMQIQGTSMTETLQDQDIVVALRGSKYETGDVIAFYYNNNILIKRVIAGTGQWVNITDDGTVYVDNVRLDEPYITDKSLGDCNIQLPYQVPDGKIFVMGDHRSTSLDSRNTALGCVSTDMVVGRLLLRAWPPSGFGPIQ